jgi:hypothetical protein
MSIGRYQDFYNAGRPQSSHGGRMPDQIWFTGPPAMAVAERRAAWQDLLRPAYGTDRVLRATHAAIMRK